MQVAHQVFQGLAKYVMNDKGEMVACPTSPRAGTPPTRRRGPSTSRRASCSSRRSAARSRRRTSSTRGTTSPTRRTSPTCRTSSRPSRACDDGGYQVDTKKGLTGVKAIDDYTLEVKLRYPFAEFSADPRPHRRRGLAGRLHQEDRRQEVQPEAGRHRPVHGRDVEEQPVRRPGQEPELLGHGERRLRRHHPHADHPRGVHRVARVPEGQPSTTRSCRRARSPRPRPTPTSRAASGPPRRGPTSPSTSSAST